MTLDLQDKLYTSTQVADILGVSLRTLYRYMEDGRIQSMRTASGRHRFTKDHITEFLNAGNFDPQDLIENERMGSPIQNVNAAPVQNNQFGGFAQSDPFNPKEEKPTRYDETQTRYPYQQPQQYGNYQNQESIQKPVAPAVTENTQYKPFGEYRSQTPTSPIDVEQRQNFAGSIPSTNQNPFKNNVEDDVFFSPSSRNSFLKTPVYGSANNDPFMDDEEPVSYQRPVAPTTEKPVENIYNRQREQRLNINENRSYDRQQPAKDNSTAYQQSAYRPQFDTASQVQTEIKPKEQVIMPDPAESFTPKLNIRYYKSDLSDLLELARKIKDVGKARDLEYAFTLFAGLSLHFFIKPFTILHFYANPEDMQIWREDLRLNPVTNKDEANIGILVNTDIIFIPNRDIAGFRVVEDKLLLRDLSDIREEELVKQFRQHLMSN